MRISHFKLVATSFALAATMAITASAQDANQNDEGKQRDSQKAAESSQQSSQSRQAQKSKQSKKSQQSQSQANSELQIEPKGWITVESDYNDDGFYDTFETIYYYDFVKAREASQKRGGNQSEQASSGNQSQKQMSRKASIQGEITELNTENSKSGSGETLTAKLENSQGQTANVCLGPKQKMSKLNLEKGDTISAEGVVTRRDDKLVLLAAKVSANGETITHKLVKRPSIKRLEGKLTSVKEAKSKSDNSTFLVVQVETDNGTEQVHLGPKNQLSSLDLSKGDNVNMLVRTGKVSGNDCTLAVQVSANDKTVKVIPPKRSQDDRKSANRDS